ncbi:response regulator transcription factor [Oscillospiraceae bacterium 38-13]
MNTILIAEDEAPIANLIKTALDGAGYCCVWAPDGGAAADLLESRPFDLALLDIMLPVADGYEILEYCKTLEVPVIFLTARGQVEDRVKGLRLGAEDYIVKPFELMELLARVETVLRRCGKTGRVLTLAPDIEIDTASRVVRKGGQPVALTAKEYDLLLLFMQNRNIALYRDRIYEKVWGEEFLGDSRTVDLHIQRMRKKLGLESRLVAIYKVGYRLESEGGP